MRGTCVALVVSLALAACEAEVRGGAKQADATRDEGETRAWSERLSRIAKSFEALGRVDDAGRMAPTDCRAPEPARARASASPDEATHGGKKLYSVFAKAPEPYRALTGISPMRARETPMDVDGTEGCS